MNKYILLEIGKSAYTEFKMKNGEFEETQDAVLVDEIEANSKEEAYEKVINSSQHKNKVFNNLIIKQVI
ncbi:MAG TPA: hypothetical protein PLX15_04640 [Candidatus Woesearchaeota archaeon]|nr:hypothetical protein [Candidatus Woesearchaeota archaeon]